METSFLPIFESQDHNNGKKETKPTAPRMFERLDSWTALGQMLERGYTNCWDSFKLQHGGQFVIVANKKGKAAMWKCFGFIKENKDTAIENKEWGADYARRRWNTVGTRRIWWTTFVVIIWSCRFARFERFDLVLRCLESSSTRVTQPTQKCSRNSSSNPFHVIQVEQGIFLMLFCSLFVVISSSIRH